MIRRRYVLLISLFAGLLMLSLGLLDTRWGLEIGIKFASAIVPGQINVKTVQGSLLGPIQLRNVHYQHGQLKLDVRKLDVAWVLPDLLMGKLSVRDFQASGVQLRLPKTSSKASQTPSFVLPVDVDLQQAKISNIELQQAIGTTLQIEAITLSASLRRNQLKLKLLQVAAYRGVVKFNGNVSLKKNFPLALAMAFDFPASDDKTFSGQGRLQGNMLDLKLSQHLTGSLRGSLQLQAHNVLTRLDWQAELALARLGLHQVFPRLPVVAVNGLIRASGDENVFRSEAELQLDDKQFGQSRIRLQTDSNFSLTQYHLATQGSFNGISLPNAKFSAEASGGRERLIISKLDAQLLKGSIHGQGELRWKHALNITGTLDLHNLDISQIAPDWPGSLSARLVLDTSQTQQIAPINFSLQEIHGQLRGHTINGKIDGEWLPENLLLKTASLNIAGTRVFAQGRLAHNWNLQFYAQSDRLDSLLPSVHGKLDMHGVLRGDARTPQLVLEAKAEQLIYKKRRVGKLSLNMDMGLAQSARSYLDLQAIDVNVGDALWQNVQLQVRGSNVAQSIVMQAQGKRADMKMVLHGQFRPWQWQGELEQFDLDESNYGHWQLQRAVKLQLAREHVSLSSFCLAQNTAHLCLEGNWSASKRQARLDVRTMPLHLLKPWLSPDVQLDGIVNAQARLDTNARGNVIGDFVMEIPDKSVTIHLTRLKQTLSLKASRLRATLDNKGLQADLRMPLANGGYINSQVRLPNWSPKLGLARTQPVMASLKLTKFPANVLANMIPEVAQAKGDIAADLHVIGSLGEPQLHGNTSWQGGSVLVTPLGINIHDVSAIIGSKKPNIIKFNLKAKSGAGDMQLTGQTQLDPTRGWPTQASLSSHQLEVSNIPEAHINVDSNLAIQLQGSKINVSGDIKVPKARLRPRQLPVGGVPVSPDVLIVNAGKQTTVATRWQLTTHIHVRLGDDVDFKGFGISGKLHGDLNLNEQPGKLILGQGEISISNGTYRLRGQDLTIRHGRLIYSNTFIDDPALDVEAVRVVNNVTAGVRLKGTLKQPQLTIFSEPTMSQTDALAYLLFGHSLNQTTQTEGQSVSNAASALGLVAGNYLAKGIGGSLGLDELRVDVNQTTQSTSLVLGKYLSPKLYLRYYNGIAESSRILQLQYQLSRRVQIQTESGYRGTQSIAGGDIFFTVEY